MIFLFCIICCFITYKITCYKIIELDKINVKTLDMHQEFLNKSLEEISALKSTVLQIKKDKSQ